MTPTRSANLHKLKFLELASPPPKQKIVINSNFFFITTNHIQLSLFLSDLVMPSNKSHDVRDIYIYLYIYILCF